MKGPALTVKKFGKRIWKKIETNSIFQSLLPPGTIFLTKIVLKILKEYFSEIYCIYIVMYNTFIIFLCTQNLHPFFVYNTSILSMYSIPPFSPCIQYLHHLILYNTSIISFYTIPPSSPFIQYLHPLLIFNTSILTLYTIPLSSL